MIDLPIPGNDDAMRAIEIILRKRPVVTSVIEGKSLDQVKQEEADASKEPRRRSTRSQFRARRRR